MSHRYSHPQNNKFALNLYLVDFKSKIINYCQILLTYIFSHKTCSSFFTYNNQHLAYFCHPYNNTRFNERIIEIPIVRQLINQHHNSRILEIGAVMQHYQPVDWQVIDKYEQGEGISNLDILNFKSKHQFDSIFSISTLEHVGQDDDEIDPDKSIKAIKHLQTLLTPTGLLVATIPSGYNLNLDAQLESGAIPFNQINFFHRISWSNNWQQIYPSTFPNSKFGSQYNNANLIAILTIDKKTKVSIIN